MTFNHRKPTWNANSKADARNYSDPAEHAAFIVGYADGFHGELQFKSLSRDYMPNAYSAGYWEGQEDAQTIY